MSKNTPFLNKKISILAILIIVIKTGLSQCSVPSAADTSRCGAGAGIISVTGGSKSLYNWYDQETGGELLGSGNEFITPEVITTDSFYVAQYDTGVTTDALSFDGAGDYIAIEDFNYNNSGNTELTVECWIKTSDGSNQVLASYDRNRYWRLEINGSGAGTGQIGFDLMTDSGQFDFGGITRIDDGNWHHIAAVYDNGTASIYIDNVLDADSTFGTSFGDGSLSYGFVGTGSEASAFDGDQGPTDYFNGEMDDFRIWDVAKTATEIATNSSNCLTNSNAEVLIYYQMDGSSDSLVDYSLNQYHGKLRGDLSTGRITTGPSLNNCLICESTRDKAIIEVKIAPSPSIGNDTCVTSTITLDAGAGYSSYLWNTGETSRFIFADTTQFYFVSVDSTGTSCSGGDGIWVGLLTQPTGSDTSRCGPGTVTLTATGGSGEYYWYDQEIGGSVVGSGTPWDSPELTKTDTFYLASIANDTTRNGLEFDGVDDYVSLDMSFSSTNAFPTMTVEAWVKTSFAGGSYNSNWAILDFDRSEYFSFFVSGDDGTVGFSTTGSDGVIDDFYGPTSAKVNDGIWHHIVAVYDGTDKKIYVDGNLEATKVNAHGGLSIGTGTTRFGMIGDGSEANAENGSRNNLYFEGEIDEVRLWSDVRNILEIQDNKDACIIGNESNLLTYYKMENGTGSSSLTDQTGNGNTGTLRNMDVNAVWTQTGPFVTCSCGDSPRDAVEVIIEKTPTLNLGNDTCVSGPLLLDAGAGMSSYTWQDGSTSQTLLASNSNYYSVTIDSTGLSCSATGTIIVNVGKAVGPLATDSSGCTEGLVKLKGTGQGTLRWYDAEVGGNLIGTGDSIYVGPLTGDSTFYVTSDIKNKNALSFDGNADVVAIENYNYSGTGKTEVTVEAWVKTNSTSDQIIASFDRSDFWRLEINGDGGGPGQIGFSINTNIGILDMGGSTNIADGVWHHVAAVYDNGIATVYIDGVADGTASLGSTWGSSSTRYGFLGTGSEASTYNGTQGPDDHLDGSIDEVRIWNVARTAVQIDDYKDSCLLGNETDLELYYRMSAGEGSVLNDFVANADGNITDATWTSDAIGFGCSLCSESDPVPIEAKLYTPIDSAKYISSCSGDGGTVLGFIGYGGSGNYDFKETSGVFNYAGTYTNDTIYKQIPNGGSYEVVVKDENNCSDTLTGITTKPLPNFAILGNAGTTESCIIPPYNDWFYIVDVTNRPIMAINPAGNNLGSVSATLYTESNAIIYNGNAYMERHLVVNPEQQPSSEVSVKFFYNQSELTNLISAASGTADEGDDINITADVAILKYNGPTEDGVLDTTDATSADIIEQDANGVIFALKYLQYGISGFSEFWFKGKPFLDALPVEFLNFTASKVGEKVLINWSTGAEINNDYFEVERSLNGIDFESIGTVNGQGNSTEITEYNFIDYAPYNSSTYYRIKQVDFDETVAYTELQFVNLNSNKIEYQLVPNPASSIVSIYGLDLSSPTQIQLINSNGGVVFNQSISSPVIDISNYRSGIYTMIITNNQYSSHHKLVKY